MALEALVQVKWDLARGVIRRDRVCQLVQLVEQLAQEQADLEVANQTLAVERDTLQQQLAQYEQAPVEPEGFLDSGDTAVA